MDNGQRWWQRGDWSGLSGLQSKTLSHGPKSQSACPSREHLEGGSGSTGWGGARDFTCATVWVCRLHSMSSVVRF